MNFWLLLLESISFFFFEFLNVLKLKMYIRDDVVGFKYVCFRILGFIDFIKEIKLKLLNMDFVVGNE